MIKSKGSKEREGEIVAKREKKAQTEINQDDKIREGVGKKERRQYINKGDDYPNTLKEGVIRSWKILIEGTILYTRFIFGIFLNI